MKVPTVEYIVPHLCGECGRKFTRGVSPEVDAALRAEADQPHNGGVMPPLVAEPCRACGGPEEFHLQIRVVDAPDESPCCGARVKVFQDDGTLYCRACFGEVTP